MTKKEFCEKAKKIFAEQGHEYLNHFVSDETDFSEVGRVVASEAGLSEEFAKSLRALQVEAEDILSELD